MINECMLKSGWGHILYNSSKSRQFEKLYNTAIANESGVFQYQLYKIKQTKPCTTKQI